MTLHTTYLTYNFALKKTKISAKMFPALRRQCLHEVGIVTDIP